MRVAVTTLDIGMHYQTYPNLFLSPTLPGLTNDGADLTARYKILTAALDILAVSPALYWLFVMVPCASCSSPYLDTLHHGLVCCMGMIGT